MWIWVTILLILLPVEDFEWKRGEEKRFIAAFIKPRLLATNLVQKQRNVLTGTQKNMWCGDRVRLERCNHKMRNFNKLSEAKTDKKKISHLIHRKFLFNSYRNWKFIVQGLLSPWTLAIETWIKPQLMEPWPSNTTSWIPSQEPARFLHQLQESNFHLERP